MLAGATVTTGAAVTTHELLAPALLGLVITWASAYFLKSTSTETGKRERIVDRKFIPDLSIRTLDRIIPFLVDRLRGAGLAPVFVIDELDKVDEMADCIDNLAAYLKRLVSEKVFSCFLADRAYLEYLRLAPDEKWFGRKSSLFSHRLLVSYCPWDFDDYLSRRIALDEKGNEAIAGKGQAGGARADFDVLKWVLRHRSQLHALTLRREVDSLAADDDRLNLEQGAIRTDYQSRIDLTLQMAVELTFYTKEAVGWLERQPYMQQTLIDALYWLSRSWLEGIPDVDTSEGGRVQIIEKLVKRMALEEVSGKIKLAVHGAKPGDGEVEPLTEDDQDILLSLIDSMIAFLGPDNTQEQVRERWNETMTRMKWKADAIPLPAVMEALLLGQESLLLPAIENHIEVRDKYKWRYFRSGLPREVKRNLAPGIEQVPPEVWPAMDLIDLIGANLQDLFKIFGCPDSTDVFGLLGDGWRVIPTTPAWPQVKVSIANLRALRQGAGNKASVTQDCRNVLDFHRLLVACDELIVKFLWCGAVLGSDWSNS